MAVYENTRSVDGVRFGERAFGLIATLIGAVIAWNDKRVTRNALSTLSNRELDDIGLNRSDIYDL